MNNMTAAEKLKICEKCAIVKQDSTWGPICDSSKWLNPNTNESSRLPKIGWIRGCGCRLKYKSANPTGHCIAKKW